MQQAGRASRRQIWAAGGGGVDGGAIPQLRRGLVRAVEPNFSA
jgi:hypothetical protein